MSARNPVQDDFPGASNRPAALDELLGRLREVRRAGAGWSALCPAHDDTNPSLSIRVAEDGKVLVHCHAGCTYDAVLQAAGLDRTSFQTNGDLGAATPDGDGWATQADAAAYLANKLHGTVEHIYDYAGNDGTVEFAVARLRTAGEKAIRPMYRRRNRWRIGDPKDRLLPLFRLSAIRTRSVVLVVEGEKCVLKAEELGIAATTSAHGANSPSKTDWTTIAQKRVILWADNDEPGRRYIQAVAGILRQINSEIDVRVITVAGLPEGGDICDWVQVQEERGLDDEAIAEHLRLLIDQAQPFEGDSTYCADSTGPTPGSAAWPEPRRLPDGTTPPPFPIEQAFPPSCQTVRQFIEAIAESLQVPVDLPALLALAAFALAARGYEVEGQRDWREVFAIYVLILLPSGERKSAVFSRMIGPIYAWQDHQATGMAGELTKFQNDVAVLREKVNRGRRKAASEEGEEDVDDGLGDLTRELAELEQSEPKPPSMVASEATTEAIADMLAENGERGLLASPEGDAIDVMLGRYGQGRPNFGLWLNGHAGDAVVIRRKSRAPLSLRRPVLCVAMTIQPTAAEDLLQSKQAEGRGILARFLYSIPTPRVGYRNLTPAPVPTHLSDAYGARLHQLLDVPVPAEPRILKLAPDAADVFNVFRESVETALRPGGDLAENQAWGSKLPGAILRIAAVLHVIGKAGFGDGLIDLQTMNAALSWAPYLIAHEKLVMSAGEDPNGKTAKRILSWIQRRDRTEFSENDAFNAVRGSVLRSASDVAGPLDLLAEYGWIRPLPPKPRPQSKPGRPPSPRYEVHPAALRNSGKAPLNTHNTQNPPDAPPACDAPGGGGA